MGKRYEKSPIIEALCEIQFESDTPWDLTMPGLLYGAIQHDFPERRQVRLLNVNFAPSLAEPVVQQQVSTIDRMQFLREDGTALVQVGPQFLSVNRLKPYDSWQEFSPLIRQAFEAYRQVVAPTSIHRIALRYINRFDFPGPAVDLEHYFEFYPFIGQRLPQNYSSFLAGVQIPQENARDLLQLQTANIGPEALNVLSMTLDITYSLVEAGQVSLDALFEWLDVAHNHIETVFEAAITNELRDTFGKVVG